MTTLLKRFRNHRIHVRNTRELQRAIANAPAPNVRDELILAAQRAARF